MGSVRLLLAMTLLAAVACRTQSPSVTGLRVRTEWIGVEPEQLAFKLTAEDGSTIGDREVRPAQPAGKLPPGTSVLVYLRDEYGGQTLRFEVEALAGGAVVAAGASSVPVKGGAITDVLVTLVPPGQRQEPP